MKYRKEPVFYEECFDAGIYDFYQLKKTNKELLSYDEIAIIFGMTPNNQSSVRYIKLISVLALEWINNDYPENGLHKFIEFLKKCYLKLNCWDNQIGLYAAKKFSNWNSHQVKFLWLNSNVKYKRYALYIEEFAYAEIYYHYQLVDDNNNYLSFSDLAQKYDLKKDNRYILNDVKLYLSISEKWEGNISSFHFQLFGFGLIEND